MILGYTCTAPGSRLHARCWSLGLWATAAAVAGLGCSADLSGWASTDTNRPTMGAAVDDPVDADPGTPGLTTNPADPSHKVSLAVRATAVFCCNPLSLDFAAEIEEKAMPPGTIYQWDFGDGRAATGRFPRHTYNFPGEYVVTLTAILPDGSEQTSEATLVLGVNEQGGTEIHVDPRPGTSPSDADDDVPPSSDDPDGTGAPPPIIVVARAGADQTVAPGTRVVLSAAASEGTADEPLTFRWEQRSGSAMTLAGREGATASFTAPNTLDAAEVLRFEVTVTQSAVRSVDDVEVTVEPAALPPPSGGVTADAGDDQTVEPGVLVILEGSGSRGMSVGPLTFIWAQLGGPMVNLSGAAGATAGFAAPATSEASVELLFELTVSQDDATGTDRVTVVVTGPAGGDQPDPGQLVAWLSELDPLPKVHYSYPIESSLLHTPVEPLLYEYVRITHAASLTGRGPRQHHVAAAVAACTLVNRDNPAIAATIALNFSPWHDVFPPDAPPTDFGSLHDAELDQFREALVLFRDWLAEENALQQTDVQMSALLLDHERFKVREDDPVWNQAITDKLTATYDTARSVFPEARIEWWGRGGFRPVPSGWSHSPYSTLEEPGESYACALYRVPEAETSREAFRRTYALAQEHGVSQVNPWVALAAGVRPGDDTFSDWLQDWDYDVQHSWRIGAELNDPFYASNPELYAPWDGAEVVTFYPGAFNFRTPAWGKHFVAYVRGANGIGELP